MGKSNEGQAPVPSSATQSQPYQEGQAAPPGLPAGPAPLTRAQIDVMLANVSRLRAMRERERTQGPGEDA